MKLRRSMSVCCISLLMVAGMAINCGKKGPSFEEQIKALKEQGIPDSTLSSLKVYLSNVVNFGKSGISGKEKLYKDSLKAGIAKAEAWYQQELQASKPIVDNMRKSFLDRKATLSGLPLADADSLLKIVDSMLAKNLVLQARTRMLTYDTMMNCLVANEKRAKEIRPKLIGTWKDVHIVRPNEDEGGNYKATETRIYKFNADGTHEGHEEMHGQTTPWMKEDWKFLSSGTFDLMGDTIYMFITKEKCVQQLYTRLNVKTNKWEKDQKPTYDTTITNHSKDRFMTWNDLSLEFKKSK